MLKISSAKQNDLIGSFTDQHYSSLLSIYAKALLCTTGSFQTSCQSQSQLLSN